MLVVAHGNNAPRRARVVAANRFEYAVVVSPAPPYPMSRRVKGKAGTEQKGPARAEVRPHARQLEFRGGRRRFGDAAIPGFQFRRAAVDVVKRQTLRSDSGHGYGLSRCSRGGYERSGIYFYGHGRKDNDFGGPVPLLAVREAFGKELRLGVTKEVFRREALEKAPHGLSERTFFVEGAVGHDSLVRGIFDKNIYLFGDAPKAPGDTDRCLREYPGPFAAEYLALDEGIAQ